MQRKNPERKQVRRATVHRRSPSIRSITTHKLEHVTSAQVRQIAQHVATRTTATHANYLRNIPSAKKANSASHSGGLFSGIRNLISGGIQALAQRILNIENTLKHLNISQLKKDIAYVKTHVYNVEQTVGYYATHLGALKTLLLNRIVAVERAIKDDVTKDVHIVEGDISKVTTEIRTEIHKGESALHTLVHKVFLYAEKVYATARKDITRTERRLETLWKKDKKYLISFFKLYLEMMFPWLFLKHILSDRLVKVFAWWIFHVIEKILFEI